MTTYYHQNSEIQGPDGMQTLVLMNPSYVQYTAEPPLPGSSNLVFLNPASATAPTRIAHAQPPQQTQQFLGIPVSTLMALQDQQNAVHATHGGQGISPLHGLIPRMQYNLWNSVEPSSAAPETPAISCSQQGALSLSLFSQQQQQQQPSFRSLDSEREPPQPAASSRGGGGASGGSQSLATVVTSIGIGGVLGIQGLLLSSKYLKAAQELLDEVVNAGSGIKKDDTTNKATCSTQSNAEGKSSPSVPVAGQKEDASRKGEAAQLSMAEREEIQMKKTKLIAMLDETEQRYRHYHQQMRIVISSFEKAAGVGSAGSYTALALRTISRQFRCLKDSIAGQIKAANKSIGEKDGPQGQAEGSRLKFVDHQIRQQHALQQLGMIQQHPWRPQRGLPEHSVSILRSWLFEHFLHPYPKDSDKRMLAKQTGLTRSQVSNWFINARVRLWKPMVEEMYSEEMKEHEQRGMDEKTGSDSIDPNEDSTSKSSSLHDKGPSSENNILGKCFNSMETNSTPHDAPATLLNSTASIKGSLRSPPGSGLMGSLELEGITQVRPKKPRSTEGLHSSDGVPFLEDQLTVKCGDARREARDGYSILSQPVDFIREIGQCPIREMGRFGAEQFVPGPTFTSSNAVSLTLGLRQTENLSPLTDHHRQPFLPSKNVRLETRVKPGEGNQFGVIDNSATSYETIDIQNHKGNFCPTSLPYLSNF